jgi:hypothetical protein
MAPPRKPHQHAPTGDTADLLQVLMFHKLLTREQAERVRRYAKTNSIGIVPTVVELKLRPPADLT